MRAQLVMMLGIALVWLAATFAGPASAQSTAPGGFVELATSTTIRPPIAPTLPSRGRFVFPAPYNTIGVRLTNASDCGGDDCVDYVGYSYWRNSNNHVGSNTMLIFITLDRNRGGGGPTLFSYDKLTDSVAVVGPLFDAASHLSWATGEGWHWSATLPNALYVNEGPRLYRYDVVTRKLETVFDVSTKFGVDRIIWQIHTSNDDRVHSATLRSSVTDEMLGCLVYQEDTKKFSYFAKVGDFDECQVDKSGRWLLIKENVDGLYGEDNSIIDLQSNADTIFLDQAGAAGHSDSGYGYMVAEDNWYALPGADRVWTFGQALPGISPQGQLVYRTTNWSVNIGHVSHANARPGVPLEQQYACGAIGTRFVGPRANEIVCFRLDGSLQVLVVAPTMTDLDAAGGGTSDYAKLPKGNLDITGRYYIWSSNGGRNRLDAFVVKIPSEHLDGPSGNAVSVIDDFNGDGRADILWRNTSGDLAVWLMNANGTSVMAPGVPGGAGTEWTIVGVGDFDGDGRSDILWRDSSGVLQIWFMNGTSISSTGSPGSVDASWTFQGIGDFNGDGKADILWRRASGAIGIWLMDGTSIIGTGSPASIGASWTFQGIGDFDGDGKADVLWRNSSGLIYIWFMNGTSISSTGAPASVGSEWTIQGIGDFNGDGKADVLWRHSSGLIYIWLMNGGAIDSVGSPTGVDSAWTIEDVADFDGDGKADVLWRHSSGLIYIWLMNGTAISSTGSPGGVGPEWDIQ